MSGLLFEEFALENCFSRKLSQHIHNDIVSRYEDHIYGDKLEDAMLEYLQELALNEVVKQAIEKTTKEQDMGDRILGRYTACQKGSE
ncbi:Uracil permease [Venturia inaequalis]|uniref:Uncharacterized protein n=1 Tax=Venturia inaequalis TaxID=5025 RepID=A0A8H3VLC6_VENIN|nr:hypothetical protein EG327_001310 [Venturia inaequalis]RDI87948.1 Uracil permease [Venturia inaequalis]